MDTQHAAHNGLAAGNTVPLAENRHVNLAPPVSMERLREAMGDNAEEVCEILEICVTQMTKHIAELHRAIASDDANALDLIGHNCAGVSANCGFTALVAPFRELESMGRESRLAGAAEVVARVEKEFARTQVFLHEQVGDF